jgi:hypothetical protein
MMLKLFVTLQLSYLYENDINNKQYEKNTNHCIPIPPFE